MSAVETSPGPEPVRAVGRRTARGASWSALAFVADKAVVFAATAILAHLLTPREFGVVAIAMVVISYVERVSEGGLEPAVITFPGPDRTTVDHAVGLSLGLGLVFTVVGVVSAPLVAVVFNEPEVAPVVAVLSVLYLTTSVRKVMAGVMARRMQFGRRVVPELIRAVIKAVVMISMAWLGFGVWALTIGHLVGGVVGVVAYVVAVGTRFRPRISASTTPALLRLGGSFSLIALLGTLIQNVDYLFLGIRADTEAVGLYSMGFRIPELTVLALPMVASPALITAYSKVLDAERLDGGGLEGERLDGGVLGSEAGLRNAYLESLKLLSIILIPVGLGLSLVADDVVPLLFGDQWSESVPVVRVVGLMGIVAGLGFPIGDALKALDQAMVLVRLAAVRLAVTVPVLWWAAGESLTMLAVAQLSLAFGHLVAFALVAQRTLGSTAAAQLATLRSAALAGLAMVAAVLVVRAAMVSGPGRLMVAIMVGAVSYGLVVLAVDRRSVQRLTVFLPGSVPGVG